MASYQLLPGGQRTGYQHQHSRTHSRSASGGAAVAVSSRLRRIRRRLLYRMAGLWNGSGAGWSSAARAATSTNHPARNARLTFLVVVATVLGIAGLLWFLGGAAAAASYYYYAPPSESPYDDLGVFAERQTQHRLGSAWHQRFASQRIVSSDGTISVVTPNNIHLPMGYSPVSPERVCILQADDRPLSDAPTQGPFWTSTAYAVAWYAMLHGYQYARVPSIQRKGYHYTWGKLQPMLDALDSCDYVMFLDSDAFVVQPQLSFDTLRVRWGLSDDIAWLMQEDPDLYTRYDGQQEQVANTGFWMLKNDRRTKQMLEDLIHCPERHPGCGYWKKTRFHEQTAFNDYIRRDYTEGIDYVLAPCEETFGSPTDSDCHGTIIRHRAGRKSSKHLLTDYVNEMFLQAMYASIDINLASGKGNATILADTYTHQVKRQNADESHQERSVKPEV